MPAFAFNARDESGRPQSGSMEAGTTTAVVDQLRARGWLVVSVQEDASASGGGKETDWLAGVPFTGPRSIDVELSLQQLAVMLRGGLTLLASLNMLTEQATRRSMRRVWRQVVDDIQTGESFSEAIAEHSCIPDYVVRLARVGEQTGILESVLVQGSEMIRARRDAKMDLITALAYPMFVGVAAIGVTIYMVVYLIPKLGNFLRSIGKDLPAMTQMLLDISDFFVAYGLAILATLAVLGVAFTLTYMSEPGRLLIDRIALRIPIIGKILRLAGTATFARSLCILVRSGVTVLEGLVTVEQMHGNKFLALCVRNAREDVMQGKSLNRALRVRGSYLPLLPSMVAVAEQAGNLDDVLEEVADFHERQMKAKIRQLSAMVTPVVTVVVGSIVGFVYIAFFMALFAAAT